MTAEFSVVNLKVLNRSAELAAPAVAFQNLSVKLRIGFGTQPDSRSLRPALHHDACW